MLPPKPFQPPPTAREKILTWRLTYRNLYIEVHRNTLFHSKQFYKNIETDIRQRTLSTPKFSRKYFDFLNNGTNPGGLEVGEVSAGKLNPYRIKHAK